MTTKTLFPILYGYKLADDIKSLRAAGLTMIVVGLPWEMLQPHEAQAKSNHGGQSLARLAERGGLGVCEAVAVLRDRRWHSMPQAEAQRDLAVLLCTWNATRATDPESKGEL